MKLLPETPTEDMWGGTARQLVKYMQMKDRYCPASLKKHFDLFVGEIPEWLNEEVNDWTSEHAFATADLGVFIYKAMYHEFKECGVKIISGSTALVEYKKGSVIMCLPFGLNPEQCTRSDWDTVHHLKEEDFTNNSYIFKLEE